MPTIDLTSRIIQDAPPAKPSRVRWHPWRRWLQVACGVLIIALPLTNGLRVDVRTGAFYCGWHRMALGNTMMVFWTAILGLWTLATVSFLYGRLWCGWVCPQTLASDFADSLKKRIDRAFRARPGGPRFLAARAVWSAIMLTTSVGTGMLIASYWLAPATVARATLQPLSDIPAALTVYIIAAVLTADLLWVRRQFCSKLCPYGPMLGTLVDKNTLAVRYLDERDDDCIRCGKCVTDCPMGIDIKKGVGQYDCIGCGECVDACNDVLGKRGVPGLIEYRYGVEPSRQMTALTLSERLGLWDGRRVGVLGVLAALMLAVGVSIFGRLPLSATASATGDVSVTGGTVTNGYIMSLTNGGPDDEIYAITVTGISQAAIQGSRTSPFVTTDSRLNTPRFSVKRPPASIQAAALRVTAPGRGHVEVPFTVTAPSNSARKAEPITVTVSSKREHIAVPLMFLTEK